jgi:hypothetical protein
MKVVMQCLEYCSEDGYVKCKHDKDALLEVTEIEMQKIRDDLLRLTVGLECGMVEYVDIVLES